MRVSEALREATRRLTPDSDTARLDAEWLMAHALGISRSAMLLSAADRDAPANFDGLVERRARGEPLAYICETQDFYGRCFRVSPAVLIPRSDSESVVEAALDHAPNQGRILDCGVGSGALLLTMLAEKPQLNGIGIDRSGQALEIAAGNAKALNLAQRVQLEQRDWTKPGWQSDLGQFDCIIANPPYVEIGAQLDASVRDFEPAGALFAGPDGLDDYRCLIPQLPDMLTANGVVILEIGASQAAEVSKIAEQTGFATKVCHDLAGRSRALILRFPLGKSDASV
ncbi:peptide chain release factor N(5)-glutamine methyltransferase [Altericroceibacterium endophyticum]|uniref:Release factor glutamine methyltransferase n=1 Tax=Altericroceibacterium endophyticum TaxID=1808508 RepID=A0A6I4T4X3_9SPHN|nr:peptide chain release factor N(5)-glutamine methyltransferase [Altericroceibacterium endophyticum]MXO65449.1 peptide chain release factor N(5)-glutamine methyltransferase [Altericroceibacterium endophyticum]